MRLDAVGARTWLLAAVAGWAVLAWLLAVFGMGGRIAPLADDPALIKPIPALSANAGSRLGPITQYAEIGARPLFAEDRRPRPFSLQGDAQGTDTSQAFDYVLTGVLITPRLQLATLQSPDGSKSERVKLGQAPESHPAWRLSVLNARSAVFDGPGDQRTIELRVFDGVGGQAPTAVDRALPVPVGTAQPSTPPQTVDGTATKPTPTLTPTPTPSSPASPTPTPGVTPEPAAAAPVNEQAQMEAIRQRIQARRAQLRQQSQSPQPPANDR